jgi:glycosyltransferase involved in cell wall biosynthesis
MDKDIKDKVLGLPQNKDSFLIQQNFEEFGRLTTQARHKLQHGQYHTAAIYAEIAALHATAKHSGLFVSPCLENILLEIGQKAISTSIDFTKKTPSHKALKKVLHVATSVQGIGGMTRMIWRWISQDIDSTHSIALTRQADTEIPDALKKAVSNSHGEIYILNEKLDDFDLIPQAKRLRELASTVDLVILHIYNFDVVPIIAFADRNQTPPILFLDHADHLFWLGASISDIVISLRESAWNLAQKRRGIASERSVLLPIVIDPSQRDLSRVEAKRLLGIPEDSVLLLSIARATKYNTIDGISFADAHVSLLKKYEQVFLVVVGAGYRADWTTAIEKTQGRIISYSEREDTAIFYQAADIYVDSFPFNSTTSLLEAGSYSVPLVSRFPYSDASTILGADMPGLTGTLIRTKNIEEYMTSLSRLIENKEYCLSLGEATHRKIIEIHTKDYWKNKLEEIYTYATNISSIISTSNLTDQPFMGEPDIFISKIHGGDNNFMDSVIQSRLRAIPFVHRLSLWFKLVRKYGLRHRIMIMMPKQVQLIYRNIKMSNNFK